MTYQNENEITKFMDEFDILLKKYSIDDVILTNFDDDSMGFRQLVKIIDNEDGKYLILSYSGKDETLCPYCAEKNENCNHKENSDE